MKTMTAALFAAAMALGGAAYAQHDHGKAEEGQEHGAMVGMMGEVVTLQGEVVDLACYMGHEGKGEKHVKCAKACLLGGAPAGILGADGSVVLLVENHEAKKPYKAVLELAGQQATVTGKKYIRGGLTAVVVSAVKKG